MKSVISGELSDKLAEKQNVLARADTPVLIVFECGSGRVLSRMVNEVSRALEPRFVSYHYVEADDSGVSPFAKILKATPAKGEVVLMDRSWYAVAINRYYGGKGELQGIADLSNAFENYLMDNGTRIIKIMLEITPESMEKYAEEYRPYTALTGSYLSSSNIDRVKYSDVMDDLISLTDTKRSPWNCVKVEDVESTVTNVAKVILKRFEEISEENKIKPEKHSLREMYPNVREGMELVGDDSKYGKKMEALSAELERLQILLSLSDFSMVLCFEGWDAAGKGGCIKHVTHALNPRGYKVDRVKKPEKIDYAHTYMWRFADWLPEPGHISFFDRTWYGRMLVEPIEGFCTVDDYSRAADEINMFEKIMTESNVIVLKFWLEISTDEQSRRFADRQANPLKTWKFTDEDIRNQAKNDIYPEYIDRMIATTNTPDAPWIAVGSENKKSAHLKVMQTIVDALKARLEQ